MEKKLEVGKTYIVSAMHKSGFSFKITPDKEFTNLKVKYLGQETDGFKLLMFQEMDTNEIIKVNPRVVIYFEEVSENNGATKGGKRKSRHSMTHKKRKATGKKSKSKKYKTKKH
jgi:hypothetical protein